MSAPRAAVVLAWLGSGPVNAVTGALVGGRRGALRWELALALAGALEGTLKALVPRPGPAPRASGFAAARIPSRGSMPSGHTMQAVMLAVLAARRWPHPAVYAAGLAWVLAIAWSRVAVGAHWPGDVAVGAALGLLLAPALPRPGATGS